MVEKRAGVKAWSTDGPTPHFPSFREATALWLRIGLLSFGGPAGQIALMHRELVEQRRWISEQRFLHALNFCMLLPGPEAQQLATYVGWLLHGARGGIVAGTLFVLPGFLVILALSATYALFQDTSWLAGLFYGLQAAVLAVVLDATIRLGRRALKTPQAVGVAALAFVALWFFGVAFPLVVAGAALFGLLQARRAGSGAKAAADPLPSSGHRALIDDDAADVAVPHGHTARTFALWGLLWIAPLFLIVPVFGWSNTYSALMGFFSQMAVTTFGGAYAVLSFVAQQAVEGFGWLTPEQMLDGLALAETTPGPLVLVLTYVGFMAGFQNPMGLPPLAGGLLGATLATWVTFIPCFLWIFLGAPHVERLRENRALAGALATVTAAVVGVILNLALWFGLHVLFGQLVRVSWGPVSTLIPKVESLDPAATALFVLAGVLLIGLRRGVPTTLGVSAGLGLLLALIR